MKVAGIICEYNPFHNGHLYQINKTKEYADAVICVMSGNFVQRGYPAVTDKFTRAKCAVMSGADLIIELPVVFSCQSAEGFSLGGVSLLDKCGIVNYLSFGCESENITVADEKDEKYLAKLDEYLKTGLSFPSARAKAIRDIFGIDISDKPNDILAYQYMKALKELDSSIIPKPMKREFQEYHSMTPGGIYASASYIRQNPENAKCYIPKEAFEEYEKADKINKDVYETIVLSHLRTVTPKHLANISDCSEGLENRLISMAVSSSTYEELINSVKTKRYTRGRIERIIVNSLIGIDKDKYSPEYVRVLAMNDTGRLLLREMKEKCSLPLITNLSKQKPDCKSIEFDIKASSVYALLLNSLKGDFDYTVSPVVI